MKQDKPIKYTIIITLTVLLLISIPAMLALNPKIYYSETKKTEANVLLEDSQELYGDVYNFLKGNAELNKKFTNNEINHMRDVQKIFSAIKNVTLINVLLLLLVLFLKINIKIKKQNLKCKLNIKLDLIKYLKTSTIIALSTQILLIVLILINFNETFMLFHEILFPQGNWMFAYDSLLITLFPEQFFINISKKIMLATIAINIGLLLLAIIAQRKINKSIKLNKKNTTNNNTKKQD